MGGSGIKETWREFGEVNNIVSSSEMGGIEGRVGEEKRRDQSQRAGVKEG